MATSTTRKSFRQKVLKKLYRGRYPIVSTTTAIGTGTTNMEDSALVGGAVDNDYLRAWIYIVETVASGPTYGEVSRVTNQSSGDLTLSPAFTATPQTGTDYELHYVFHPEEVNNTLDEVLERLEYPIMVPYGLNTNPGMETWTSSSACTGYTASAGTIAQESTIVKYGRYSLKFTNIAPNDRVTTSTVNVSPGDALYVATNVFVTYGDVAVVELVNADTGVVIESGKSDGTGWSEISFTATVPSSCERIAVYVGGTGGDDVFYFNNINVHIIGDKELIVPALAEWSFDINKLFYFPRGKGINPATASEFNFRSTEQRPKFWSHGQLLRDETGAYPYIFYPDRALGQETVWMLLNIDYPAFSGASASAKDADTTKAPMDLAVPLATVELLDRLAEKYEEQGNDRRASVMQARADRIRAREIDPIARKWYEFKSLIEGAI